MTRDRRGFTLVELLIVTVLGALVMAAALTVLITNQRTYTAQNASIQGQQATRAALEILFTELRQVSPRGGDLAMMSTDSIRVRLMRKFSRACVTTAMMTSTPTMVILDPGPVDFVAGDSVFVFADHKQIEDDDDVWIPARITQVGASVCPQDPLTPAIEIRFAGQQAAFANDSVHVGAPVRSFTSVRFGPTALFGDTYLGRAEGSAALTAVAGPIRASGGLEFAYLDALGAVTNVPTDVRQIVVNVRTDSEVINSVGEPVADSISAWVYTRN